MHKTVTMRLIPALIAITFSGGAFASGFQLSEQSASGIGVANAGAAAAAEDTSTIYFNPAGMTYLAEGHSFSLATTVLSRRTKFSDEGTTRMPVINPLTNLPTGSFYPLGDDGGNGGGTHAIPAFYYSYALTKDLRIGLGVNPTFADETEYDDNFIGRFSGLLTTIKIVNVNPSVAYRVNDQLSVAFGVDYAKADVEFKQFTPYVGSPLGVLKGDATGWGYNLGAMYQVTPDTRLGLSYRSRIKFNLEGDQTVGSPLNVNRGIKADLETPDTLSLAVKHQINDKWAVLGDYTWTGWSSLQSLEPMVKSDGSRAVAPLRYNFKDTYRVGLGAIYKLNDQWMLRAGTAYDKNPIPNDASRTMTVPDADRVWLALGAKWTITPKASLDIGYAHVFVKDSHTERQVTNTSETATLQTVRGTFTNSADMLSLQLNYAF